MLRALSKIIDSEISFITFFRLDPFSLGNMAVVDFYFYIEYLFKIKEMKKKMLEQKADGVKGSGNPLGHLLQHVMEHML